MTGKRRIRWNTVDKCILLQIEADSDNKSYKLNNTEISCKWHEKDIGVFVGISGNQENNH